jgi:SH3-like domain-containing protein
MTPATYTIFIVPSVSHAMKAEKTLTRATIPAKLVPVPRELSSQCGVCLRVAPEDRARAEQALAGAGVEITAIHEIDQTTQIKEVPK